jgi:hypothetical protein
MKNEIEAKNVDKQGTSSHREQRLVRHLLRYGGCWLFALLVYAALMWGLPLKIGGTPWAVLVAHGAVPFFAWILYGAGAFDCDL